MPLRFEDLEPPQPLPPLPRPTGARPINCPSCGHGIDAHGGVGCTSLSPEPAKRLCRCSWTTNDIAWTMLYGALTPPRQPRDTIRAPDRKSVV